MRARRVISYSAAILIAALACFGVIVTKPFAQEMMPGGEGMMGGGMPGEMGMGGGGGGGGGRTYSWVENSMPEALLMTYGEFLAEEGQAPVPLPEVYLMEEDGTPKKYTRNMWYGLMRVYEDKPVKVDPPNVGRQGGAMWGQVYLEAAVKHNEFNAMWPRLVDAFSNFWFEVGYPRIGQQLLRYDWERKAVHNPDGTIAWKRWEATLPDTFTITIPVVMHVKDKCQKTFGQKFYKAMKPFDNPGHGRSAFEFMTYEGGHVRPHTFFLADETIQGWNQLWDSIQVQLRLYDTTGEEIVRAAQPSQLRPDIFTQMVHPPVIYYAPRYRLLVPPDDDKFHGGKLGLDGKEGWYFEFEFTLSRDELKSLADAKARMWMGDTIPERLKYLGETPLGSSTQSRGGGGMEMGGMGMGMGGDMMPGGPGGGEMGMGPPM